MNTVRDHIPREIVLEVSGQLAAKKREQLYDEFRVIFGTPQTIENDIKTGKLDKNKIILMIFGTFSKIQMNAIVQWVKPPTPK